MSSVFQGYFPVYNTHLSCLQLSFQVFPEQCSSFVLEIRITDTKPDVNVHYYMITIVLLGGVLRPFLSLFVLSLLACHGGKGREKGDKKRPKS